MGATGDASTLAAIAPKPDFVPPPSPIVPLSPSSSSVRSVVAARPSSLGVGSSDDDESRYNFSDDAYELQDFGGGQAARGEGSVGAPTAGSVMARRTSGSTAASFQLYTPEEEQTVVRQFDRRLVLFLALCYLLSFLDRSSARSLPTLPGAGLLGTCC